MKITATIIGIIMCIGITDATGFSVECNDGYFPYFETEQSKEYECIKCPTDYTTYDTCSNTAGLKCNTGYYGTKTCKKCPAATIDNNTLYTNAARDKIAYKTSNIGATNADQCYLPDAIYYGSNDVGYFEYDATKSPPLKTLTACKAGYYKYYNTCTKCTITNSTTPDLNTWSACGCDIGYYMDSDKCVRCPEISGHYSDDKKTPAYGTTTGIGAIKITACIMPAGTYWDDIGSFELDSPCSYVGQQ